MNASTFRVLALGGDGIGPEVTDAAVTVLEQAAGASGLRIDLEHDLLGGAAYDQHGVFCTDDTVDKAVRANAVLVGAVGGPKWDQIKIDGGPQDKDGLMRLRQTLNVYAGLRPARGYPPRVPAPPFREGLGPGSGAAHLAKPALDGTTANLRTTGAYGRHGVIPPWSTPHRFEKAWLSKPM